MNTMTQEAVVLPKGEEMLLSHHKGPARSCVILSGGRLT